MQPFAELTSSVIADAALRVGTFLVLASLGFLLCHRRFAAKLADRKIQPRRTATAEQVRYELRWAAKAVAVFLVLFAAAAALAASGVTRLYVDVDDYGWPYLVLTVVGMVAGHDLYFYLTHRLLHHPRLLWIHKVHHRYASPTPFGTFAMHPLEAALHFGIVFIFLFAFPVHVGALAFWTVFMTSVNVLGHLGYELFPVEKMQRDKALSIINAATFHDRHHQTYRANFAFYMTVWDRLFGTFEAPPVRSAVRVGVRPKLGREAHRGQREIAG